jgi:formylglycine-generating enzyme required for sulfatase activity
MGSPDNEQGRDYAEGPQHRVTIGYRFAIGRYAVTFIEYDHFCTVTRREKPDDRGWDRGKRPVINLSWQDADAYVEWLSSETRQEYRLLSEAEWEYACRAGTTTRYSRGDAINENDANYGETVGKTTEVGVYPANPWNLYDMHGNVWEWVLDAWHDDYNGAPLDGKAWQTADDPSRRVLRGGSWFGGPNQSRSARRYWRKRGARTNKIGLRLAREL